MSDTISFASFNNQATERVGDIFKGIAEDIFESGLDSITDYSMDTDYIPPLRRYLLELDIAKK